MAALIERILDMPTGNDKGNTARHDVAGKANDGIVQPLLTARSEVNARGKAEVRHYTRLP